MYCNVCAAAVNRDGKVRCGERRRCRRDRRRTAATTPIQVSRRRWRRRCPSSVARGAGRGRVSIAATPRPRWATRRPISLPSRSPRRRRRRLTDSRPSGRTADARTQLDSASADITGRTNCCIPTASATGSTSAS